MRQAAVLVCDDAFVSLNGKITLSGIYTADIAIPAPQITVGQLVFLFVIESDVSDPYQIINLHISLPGEKPVQVSVPTAQNAPMTAERTKLTIKWPVLVPQPVLRPGEIKTKLIHERGEMEIGAAWITHTQQQS